MERFITDLLQPVIVVVFYISFFIHFTVDNFVLKSFTLSLVLFIIFCLSFL